MNVNHHRLLLSGFVAAMMSPLAHGQLIDAAFGNGNATPTGAAVIGQSGDQWNVFNVSNGTYGPFGLNDTNGNATGVSITYTSEGGISPLNTGFQPDSALMDYYMFNHDSGNIVVSLSGLQDSTAYDLYLYVASGDASNGDRDLAGTVVGSSTVNFSATGNPKATFSEGDNYLQLAVTSDANGNMVITEGPGVANTGEVDMNGFQLQPSSAPEPLSFGLLGVGVVALIRRRARKA